MTLPIARDPIYRRRRFDAATIQLCVRWYVTSRLSYRDLSATLAEQRIRLSQYLYNVVEQDHRRRRGVI